MRFVKHALIISAVAMTASAIAQVDPDRVVVKVNGADITGREYYKRMEVQPGLGQYRSGTFVQMLPGYLTLRWLIEEELLVQLAASKGMAPTDAQVEAELKLRLEDNADQVRSLLAFGFTHVDLKRRVLVDLSEFNILTEGITITDFEVEKHYEDNILRYTLPKRYQLRMIRVKGDDAKKAVDDSLANGTSFEKVAEELSVDISRYDGGRFGTIAEGDMTPSVRTLMANIAKGRTTGWLEEGDFSAKFLVEDVLEQEVLPLDDKLKRAIRETQMRVRGQAKNNLPMMMLEFRKKAKLEFGSYPFIDDMQRHFSGGG